MPQPEKSSSSQPVIIAGMHRSGTSLTASVLEKAGVDIGEELLGPGTGNRQGHFEDVNFLSLHQEILISQGISAEGWTALSRVNVPQQFWGRAKALCEARSAQAAIWGWKEPRTTLFLNYWENLLPNAKFVFVYRAPWEVMDSLFTRGDVAFHNNPKFALEVWMAYNQAILNFHHHYPERSFLLHPLALSENEQPFITQLSQKFGLELVVPEARLFQAQEMHLQVSGTHRPALVASYFPQALEIYQRLEDIADLPSQVKLESVLLPHSKSSYEDWVFQDWFAASRAHALRREAQSNLQRVQADVERSQVELQASQAQLQQLQTELHQTRTELQASQAQLQQLQTELHQTHAALEQSQTALEQSQTALEQSKTALEQTQAEVNHAELVIQSMESSKFWQLRTYWLGLKGRFRPWSNKSSNF